MIIQKHDQYFLSSIYNGSIVPNVSTEDKIVQQLTQTFICLIDLLIRSFWFYFRMIDYLIDWMIDWIGFYPESKIFQPYNGSSLFECICTCMNSAYNIGSNHKPLWDGGRGVLKLNGKIYRDSMQYSVMC